MIKIENTKVFNIAGAIYSARNAMNSWHLSDSDLQNDVLGEKDIKLAQKLFKAGTDHRKFMRMITVYMDITAPLYWWKEFDTYKVGTVANSCSTMHKIHEKEFTLDDFSCEYLFNTIDDNDSLIDETFSPIGIIGQIKDALNKYRIKYLKTKDKDYWWQMIQLLPSSYNQKRTVMLNYEVLANMYHSRKNHKLDEWVEFCKEIEELPYFKEICLNNKKGND